MYQKRSRASTCRLGSERVDTVGKELEFESPLVARAANGCAFARARRSRFPVGAERFETNNEHNICCAHFRLRATADSPTGRLVDAKLTCLSGARSFSASALKGRRRRSSAVLLGACYNAATG